MTKIPDGLQTLTLDQIHESPWNPRRFFDPFKMQELADSIKANGILEPLLARPNAKGVELAAGHRRFRAAKLAGLAEALVLVRPMADQQFLEVLLIDNLQREDLSALEEAEGYKTLMTKAGYDVARIAERIGRSEKYVYDRVKLLQLIPAAAKHLREGRITAGHAILLARLKPKDQERALAIDERGYQNSRGGVFETEDLLWNTDDDKPEEDSLKPRSVRELQAWIDEHVRFDRGAADPMLFPETATTVAAAKEKAEKIIPITHDHILQDEAKAEERTYSARTWKRADGQQKSKPCDKSVLGVVVAGPGRGEAFRVCINREKCKVHFATEQRDKAKRSTSTSGSSAQDRYKREEERRRQDQAREEAERARYRKALPAVLDALAEKVRKLPATAGGALAELLLDRQASKTAGEWIPRGRTGEDLVRHLAFIEILDHRDEHDWDRKRMAGIAKELGVDVKKIVDEAAPVKEEKPEPKGKKK